MGYRELLKLSGYQSIIEGDYFYAIQWGQLNPSVLDVWLIGRMRCTRFCGNCNVRSIRCFKRLMKSLMAFQGKELITNSHLCFSLSFCI